MDKKTLKIGKIRKEKLNWQLWAQAVSGVQKSSLLKILKSFTPEL
jgi:hypothetical protein